jgi:hypothetical protein
MNRALRDLSLAVLAMTLATYARGGCDADTALSWIVVGLSLGGFGTVLAAAPILRRFDRLMPPAPIDAGLRGLITAMERG